MTLVVYKADHTKEKDKKTKLQVILKKLQRCKELMEKGAELQALEQNINNLQ